MKNYNLFVLLLFVVSFFSCAPYVPIVLQRPAEINLKDFKKIAIGDIKDPEVLPPSPRSKASDVATTLNAFGNIVSAFKGQDYVTPNDYADLRMPAGKDLSDKITTKLFESQRFEVLDRQNIDKIIAEQKLSASGLVDESTAVELGNIIGTAALVFGRVQNCRFQENIIKGSYKDDKGNTHKTYKRNTDLDYTANLKVVDVKTGKVIAVKDIDGSTSASSYAIDGTPQNNDPNQLYQRASDRVADVFIKMIAPYTVTVYAYFEKDKLLPELSVAIASLKIGEISEALKTLQEMTQKESITDPKIKAKALYNYGQVLMYNQHPDQAIEVLKNAVKLEPTKDKYVDAVNRAKSELIQLNKLKEQL